MREIGVYGRATLKRGHLQGLKLKKYIPNQLTSKRPKGRLKARRKDDVDNDIRKVGIGNDMDGKRSLFFLDSAATEEEEK